MGEGRGRIFGVLAALAVLWIFIYWWWEPRSAVVSFDAGPPAAEGASRTGAVVEPVSDNRGNSGLGRARAPTANELRQAPVPAVIPPRFREYTIRDGDTFETIARRELGSAQHAKAIIAANPLMSPDTLQVGRSIKIPLDPANIQGQPNAAAAQVSNPEPGEPLHEYTIRPGDTLSKIAKSQYGSTSYDEFLYQANRDRLQSKDELQVGQRLRVPPKPKD
jgi:nucleoid-associated protein YgaU